VNFIFPPHLTSASALPEETGNRKPGNCVFSLKCCTLFHQKTRNTVKNITWLELNHPSLSKRSTGCTRQDLGMEHSILLSVTHMLCVSQVYHCVSRCVKMGVVPYQAWSKSQRTVLMGYLTISTNVRRYQTHHRWQFFSFRKIVHRCIMRVTQSNWVKEVDCDFCVSPFCQVVQ